MRKFWIYFSLILPNFIKIFFYRTFFKWKIGSGVKIGFSILNGQRVTIGNNVKIGHLNQISGLKELTLEDSSSIGHLNTIKSGSTKRESIFFCGENTSITSRHFIDSTGEVKIGRSVIVAGIHSQIWSHGLNTTTGDLYSDSVIVDNGCYVGSGCILLPGSYVMPQCVIGAGTTITKNFKSEPRALIVGSSAKIKKILK